MSSWGCPHELNGECLRVNGRACDPGMKGCALYGRFVWSNESKNHPVRASVQPEKVTKPPEQDSRDAS